MLVAAPFAAAALAPYLQRLVGWFSGWILSLVPIAIAVLLAPLIAPIMAGETITERLSWVPTLGLDLSFAIDGLSLTFALLILGIGAAILIYSAAYLRGYPHQGRLFSFLMLFMGAMLGVVLTDSLVALYAFWELTTVASFLLIGFDHTRQAARRAAVQALVVTTIGGLALLVAAIALHLQTGSWMVTGGGGATGSAAYPLILVCVLLAAFTKSAQVPFHFWLPSAMEAPTPVSAYLHSATMVQGGVYLLFRMQPVLGGTTAWSLALGIAGGATLLWGAVAALRQTDLKLMLAQTTVASLGLTVLLIGVGTKAALTAAVVYFVAHALYKATLFLVVGLIDNETGVRDLTALGGLRERMAVTFIAAVFAGASMLGIPPALGYFSKETMYLGLLGLEPLTLLTVAVLVVGNAVLGTVALVVMIKPFMGPQVTLPKAPREGPFGMLLAPALIAAAGVLAGWQAEWLALSIISPAASASAGAHVESHLAFSLDPLDIALWLSVLTWVLAGLLYRYLEATRTLTRRLATSVGWTFEQGFDWLYFGLVRVAASVTRTIQHGRLELYLVVVFAMLALALFVPLIAIGGVPWVTFRPSLTYYEWGIVGFAAAGVTAVVLARRRLFAVVALGAQGIAVALLYMLFGAPDLSFTQFMVEILSVVILALAMTRLHLEADDRRYLEDIVRDGGLAVLCGLGVFLVLLAVLDGPFDPRLSDFFGAYSAAVAHGHNVVNVILVDFRGLDTLGEISVVMTAGIAILALLRNVRGPAVPKPSDAAPPKPRRRRPRPKPVSGEAA